MSQEEIHLPEKFDPKSVVVNNMTDQSVAILKERFSPEVLGALDLSQKTDYEFVRLGKAEMVSKRTGIDNHKKELTRRARDIVNGINQEANHRTEQILSIETPLKEMKKAFDNAKAEKKRLNEEAETVRVSHIKSKLDEITEFFVNAQGQRAIEISSVIAELEKYPVTPEIFEEFKNEAVVKKQGTIENLKNLLDQTRSNEDEKDRLALESLKLKEEKAKLDKEKEDLARVDEIKKEINSIKDDVQVLHREDVSITDCIETSDKIHELFELGIERFEEFLEEAKAVESKAQEDITDVIRIKQDRLDQKTEANRLKEEKEKLEKDKKDLSEREESARIKRNDSLMQSLEMGSFDSEGKTVEEIRAVAESYINNFNVQEMFDKDYRGKAFERIQKVHINLLRKADEVEHWRMCDSNKALLDEMQNVIQQSNNADQTADTVAAISQRFLADYNDEKINEIFNEVFYDDAKEKRKRYYDILVAKSEGLKIKEDQEKLNKQKKIDDANELSLKVSEMREQSKTELLRYSNNHIAIDAMIDAIEKGEIPHIVAEWTTVNSANLDI